VRDSMPIVVQKKRNPPADSGVLIPPNPAAGSTVVPALPGLIQLWNRIST